MARDVFHELNGEAERRARVRRAVRRTPANVHETTRRDARAMADALDITGPRHETARVVSDVDNRARYFAAREAEAAEIDELAEQMQAQRYEKDDE